MSKGKIVNFFWRIADSLPVMLPAGVAGFSVIAMLFLVNDHYQTLPVLVFGLLAFFAICFVIYKKYPHTKLTKEQKIVTSLVFISIFAWVGFSSLFTSEHLHTNRDPATYTVAGLWLIENDSLNIEKTYVIDDLANIRETSAGFASSSDGDSIHAQGNHLLPALLGIIGRVFSPGILLHASPLFGGLMLLAVFGFARLLMKPRWAFVATAALAASLPLLYFSRDTYTEPLMGSFVFGALALFALAEKTRTLSLLALTGIVIGATTLVRIDATLSLIGILIGVGTMFVLSKKGEWKLGVFSPIVFILPMLLIAWLGWYDVTTLATNYYLSKEDKILPQYFVLAAIIVLIPIAWLVFSKAKKMVTWLDQKTVKWRGKAVVILVVVTGLILASRPFWYIGERSRRILLTPALQEREGLAINALRNYSEQTINWMIWYIGPVLVVLSLVGFAYAAYMAITTRRAIWMASLATIFAVGMLYFVAPNITPDQIWASRRFLPVVMPGIAIFGALGLSFLFARKWPFGINGKIATSIIATLAITIPLTVSYPFLFVRENYSQLAQINAICQTVESKKAVIIWAGDDSGRTLPQPVRTICNVPTFSVNKNRPVDAAALASAYDKAQENGYTTIYIGQYSYETLELNEIEGLSVVNSLDYRLYQQRLSTPPFRYITENRTILMGEVNENGSVTPLEGNREVVPANLIDDR